MKAELYRNLGEFDKCIELINSIDTSSDRTDFNSKLKKYFTLECEKENKLVFRIDNYTARKQKPLTYAGIIKYHTCLTNESITKDNDEHTEQKF